MSFTITFGREGDGDPGLVRDELRALETRKHDLDRTMASALEERTVEFHPNVAELYRRKVTELQSLLSDENTRPEAMDLIRAMVDRIEVHEGPERGKPDVTLVGALAAILAFTQQDKTAAPCGDGGRVLMVAGARNQRYLQISEGWLPRPR